MTIDFKSEQIISREKSIRKPYIGYFAPNGELIDYNTLLGGNYHDDWTNPVSVAFLSYVSYIIEGTSIEELKNSSLAKLFPNTVINNEYPGINEYVKRGYGIYYDFEYEDIDYFLMSLDKNIEQLETYGELDGYLEFEYRLLLFFRNAYKNRRFFEAIQRKIKIENPYVVQERLKEYYKNCNLYQGIEPEYREYLEKELLSYFKDICVQYLGYDALERFKPNGVEIKIPYWYEDYDFLANPRIITSSYPNVNERYYNYLIMDWTINRLPRYNYNEQTGLYEKSDFWLFYQSDKEQQLEREIQTIKRLVPLKERYKYIKY